MSLIDSFQDWQDKKAKENYFVNINTHGVRRAIRNIIWNLFDVKLCVKKIKIKENSLLVIKDQEILRTDKHLHFSDINDRDYAVFEYLERVKAFLKDSKEIREVLGIKFIDYK